jgi:hypothetical protein
MRRILTDRQDRESSLRISRRFEIGLAVVVGVVLLAIVLL